MSAKTTEVLARATGIPLCDVVVIGVKPGGDIYVNWTGSTIASLLLLLKLAEKEAMQAWDEGVDLHKKGRAA